MSRLKPPTLTGPYSRAGLELEGGAAVTLERSRMYGGERERGGRAVGKTMLCVTVTCEETGERS